MKPLAITHYTVASALGLGLAPTLAALRVGRTGLAPRDFETAYIGTWLGVVDAVFGRIDEWAISRVITRWREQVWENAVALMELPRDTRRDDVVALIEAMALERSDAILFREGMASFKHLV